MNELMHFATDRCKSTRRVLVSDDAHGQYGTNGSESREMIKRAICTASCMRRARARVCVSVWWHTRSRGRSCVERFRKSNVMSEPHHNDDDASRGDICRLMTNELPACSHSLVGWSLVVHCSLRSVANHPFSHSLWSTAPCGVQFAMTSRDRTFQHRLAHLWCAL